MVLNDESLNMSFKVRRLTECPKIFKREGVAILQEKCQLICALTLKGQK